MKETMGKLDLQEIQHVTWGLDGEQLAPWQSIQRIYRAGFTDLKICATMYAVIYYESGNYLKAWHHNVKRNADDTIYTMDGKMTVYSTDLGYIQKNIDHTPDVVIPATAEASAAFVETLWLKYPSLSKGDQSATVAHDLYLARGFDPWYAYKNGNYKKAFPDACVAVGNFLDKVINDKDGHQIIRKSA